MPQSHVRWNKFGTKIVEYTRLKYKIAYIVHPGWKKVFSCPRVRFAVRVAASKHGPQASALCLPGTSTAITRGQKGLLPLVNTIVFLSHDLILRIFLVCLWVESEWGCSSTRRKYACLFDLEVIMALKSLFQESKYREKTQKRTQLATKEGLRYW